MSLPSQAASAPQRPPLGPDLLRMSAKIVVGMFVSILAIFLVFIVFGALGAAAGGGASAPAQEDKVLLGKKASANLIREILVEGPILTHKGDQPDFWNFELSGVSYGYQIKKQLKEAAEDEDVKAVLMRVSTPGGSIVGSQAIHEGVLAVKAAKKPIAVYVDSLSASGGVWSTAAADAIFADHGSIIGSVGVIMFGLIEYVDPIAMGGLLSGVETRGGLKLHITSAGRGKDVGNPFRAPTEEEKARFQSMANEFYEKFLAHVGQHRKIPRAKLVDELGAGILANDAAQAFGFIDGTKTYEESAQWIADKLGVAEDWKLEPVEKEEQNPFKALFASAALAMRGHEAARRDQTTLICASLRAEAIVMSAPHYTALCGY